MKTETKLVYQTKEDKDTEEGCLHCEGTLSSYTMKYSIGLKINRSKMTIYHNYWEKSKSKKQNLFDIEINFCPYCGKQLRKKIDYSLLD